MSPFTFHVRIPFALLAALVSLYLHFWEPVQVQARVIRANNSSCKSMPGDANWPDDSQWAELNHTVNGQLLATVPLGHVCHDPMFDLEACEDLRNNWLFPRPHLESPAQVLTPYFQGQSCSPFTSRETPCTLGSHAVYSINVTGPTDIQAGIRFARETGIRLTIKNTGHDLLGKSTGAGSLSLWTHNMKSMEFVSRYDGDSDYSGSAVRLGAGVTIDEVMMAADERGVHVLVGTCPTVGVAGGYTSGGGHGLLSSLHGMAADSVLEWEVVTASGEHVVATPTNDHSDLYWALSGGGGGTFAVVVSLTTRTHADVPMAGASMAFDVDSAGGVDEFWRAAATFQSALGPVVDTGAVAAYALTATGLFVFAVAMPQVEEVVGNRSLSPGPDPGPGPDGVLEPVSTAMKALDVDMPVAQSNHTGFLDLFNSYFLEAVTTTPQAQITAGRLIPRSLMNDLTTAEVVTQAFRAAADLGFLVSCVALNAGSQVPLHDNAVFKLWREALMICIIVESWDFSRPWEDMVARQKLLNEVVMPKIEAATPGGGAYLNEASFLQADWQNAFYGENYPRLKSIKDKYDPGSLFYARTAVGSETWSEDEDGRLCSSNRCMAARHL